MSLYEQWQKREAGWKTAATATRRASHAVRIATSCGNGARRQLLADTQAHGVRLAALSCHGNPLHPNPQLAAAHQADLMAAIEAMNGGPPAAR